MAKNRPKSSPLMDRLRAAAEKVQFAAPPKIEITARDQDEHWQIVVTGTIDTRQHSPNWYRLIECISEAELEEAKKTLTVVQVPIPAPATGVGRQPNVCQFDTGQFAIIVVPDRWIIQTIHEHQRARIAEVASIVFRRLNEIYVSAFGVNRLRAVRTHPLLSKQFLADRLARTGLAFPAGKGSGQVTYTLNGDVDTNITVFPSPVEEHRLTVTYNRHHQIIPQEGYYDVGEMITKSAEPDWASAADYASQLTEEIQREIKNGKR